MCLICVLDMFRCAWHMAGYVLDVYGYGLEMFEYALEAF